MLHVAIVDDNAVERLLAGVKRVESRFCRRRIPPYSTLRAGDPILIKRVGGGLVAATRALRVRRFADLTPARVDRLRRTYNDLVCAPIEYWDARRESRYAVLIWLDRLSHPGRRRIARQYGRAWLSLPTGRAPAGKRDPTRVPSQLSQRNGAG